MDRTKRISVKDIKIDTVSLNSSERPIDYGHCREIMIDKYGEERGSKMYDSMIDLSSARYFQVASKILLEKKAMHWFLINRLEDRRMFRSLYERKWSNISYEELYDIWFPIRKS